MADANIALMKKFSPAQMRLLACLADGLCHSGNDLGVALNVSRTAIWKSITHLIDLGLPIERLPHRGYRLTTPMILLNTETISQHLKNHQFNKQVDCHLFASLDSTNRLLKTLPHRSAIDICCAETQTEGRGRFGRQWYSPFGENIYLSCRWHLDCDLSRLSGLSLVVSLAILAALDEIGVAEQIRVKWPNDILWHHKKLCGNLIEVVAESNSSADVIIGIGLNVNSITTEHAFNDKPWCSLLDITGQYTDRNQLIARLIIRLDEFLQTFMLQGFAAFMPKWRTIDYLQGKRITIANPTGPLIGRADGVNESGQLILIDDLGATHYLSSGDTTLNGI